MMRAMSAHVESVGDPVHPWVTLSLLKPFCNTFLQEFYAHTGLTFHASFSFYKYYRDSFLV